MTHLNFKSKEDWYNVTADVFTKNDGLGNIGIYRHSVN